MTKELTSEDCVHGLIQGPSETVDTHENFIDPELNMTDIYYLVRQREEIRDRTMRDQAPLTMPHQSWLYSSGQEFDYSPLL